MRKCVHCRPRSRVTRRWHSRNGYLLKQAWYKCVKLFTWSLRYDICAFHMHTCSTTVLNVIFTFVYTFLFIPVFVHHSDNHEFVHRTSKKLRRYYYYQQNRRIKTDKKENGIINTVSMSSRVLTGEWNYNEQPCQAGVGQTREKSFGDFCHDGKNEE